jgi:hypothetical protein
MHKIGNITQIAELLIAISTLTEHFTYVGSHFWTSIMYLRPIHAEPDIITLREFLKADPLGVFTTAMNSPTSPCCNDAHIFLG